MKLISYVFVDPATGEVEASGVCAEDDFDRLQEADHQIKVIGLASRATHYFTPAGLCAYTPEQREAKARKKPHCNWDNLAMCWVDVRQFQELRRQRWGEIKAARQAAVDAEIVTPFGTFDADPRSRAAIAEVLAFRGQPTESSGEALTWTTADNQAVKLTLAQLGELARLLADRTQSCHDQARRIRASIEAAATPQELAAITWPQAP